MPVPRTPAEYRRDLESLSHDQLVHIVLARDKLAIASRKFWVRAAKAALAGDPRELRNRVDLAEAEPVDIVLSESKP